MGHQHILKLVGVHVEARDHDHVFLAIDNAQVAVGLHQRNISSRKPTVAVDHLVGCISALPVTRHHLRTSHTELSRLVEPECVARIVANLDLGAGHRHANGTDLHAIARVPRYGWGGFGQPVALRDYAPRNVSPAIRCIVGQRHAARQCHLQI